VSHVAKEHYFEGSHNLEESSDFEGIGQGSLDYAVQKEWDKVL